MAFIRRNLLFMIANVNCAEEKTPDFNKFYDLQNQLL